LSETSTGLNIAALARRTGVAPDTLRKWEQRYKILQPTRTAGGQRRYTERDVERVEWLRARLEEGYRIGEAAALLGIGSDSISRTTAEHRDAILAAVGETDAPRLSLLLDQAFALHSVEELLTKIVEPVLVKVGERWAQGELSVAQEHLATEAIRTRLGHLLADVRGGVRGVSVLACAPGERHDLGLLMLAILLRADGWQVIYLGQDTPLDDAVRIADSLNADMLGISIAMPEHGKTLLPAKPRDAKLVIGGTGASDAIAERLQAHHVNGTLIRSVRTLRKLGR
jgi:methanogenic corrinoid protein MtbC1